jgi:hypothetical protein
MSQHLISDLEAIVADYSTNDDIKKLETINPIIYSTQTTFLKTIKSNYTEALTLTESFYDIFKDANFKIRNYMSYTVKFKNIDPGFVCCALYNLPEINDNTVIGNKYFSDDDFLPPIYYGDSKLNVPNSRCIYDSKSYVHRKILNQCKICLYQFTDTIKDIMCQYGNTKTTSFPAADNHEEISYKYHLLNNIYMNRDEINKDSLTDTMKWSYDDLGDVFSVFIVQLMWPECIHTKTYNTNNFPIDLFYESFEIVMKDWEKILTESFIWNEIVITSANLEILLNDIKIAFANI